MGMYKSLSPTTQTIDEGGFSISSFNILENAPQRTCRHATQTQGLQYMTGCTCGLNQQLKQGNQIQFRFASKNVHQICGCCKRYLLVQGCSSPGDYS